jgi:hypothetical protein
MARGVARVRRPEKGWSASTKESVLQARIATRVRRNLDSNETHCKQEGLTEAV